MKVHKRLNNAVTNRSAEQIRNRWKTLKTSYYKAKELKIAIFNQSCDLLINLHVTQL